MPHGVRLIPDPRITRDYLWTIFNYDPETGIVIRLISGRVVGQRKTGRPQLDILGKKYSKSLVVWCMMTGAWPQHEVDHEDKNKQNDRWSNLRPATRSQNNWNRRPARGMLSSYLGVRARGNKWCARITCNKKQISLGIFPNEIDAARAHDIAAVKHHGPYASLNFPEMRDAG